jgi:hypothetical protein
MKDPTTLTVEEECPRCGYYLKQFMQMIMATSEHIPSTVKYFCTGCLTTRDVPGTGKGSFALSCYNCRKQVAERWAEFLSALAAMSVYIMGECHPLEVDGPARLSDPPESLQNWIDALSIHLITLLRDGATNETSMKCSGVPNFSLFTCILELNREDLANMIIRDTTHHTQPPPHTHTHISLFLRLITFLRLRLDLGFFLHANLLGKNKNWGVVIFFFGKQQKVVIIV